MTKTPEDVKKDVDKLKKEKSALIEKNRSLAEIIEEITKEQRDDEEPKSKHSRADDEDVASAVKKEIQSEFSGLESKLKELDKLSELANKMKDLSDQVKSASKPRTMKVQGPLGETEVPVDQAPTMMNPFGNPTMGTQVAQNVLSQGAGPIGKALASFGQDVDFQSEIIEIKNTLADVNKDVNGLQKRMEYRVSRLEDEIKALDKISSLEQGFEEISEKLSRRTCRSSRGSYSQRTNWWTRYCRTS